MAKSGTDSTTGHPKFSNSDAPDVKVDPQIVAEYAAEVGTRLIGTTAERLAYPYTRDGLGWYDTDRRALMVRRGSGWRTVWRDVDAVIDSFYTNKPGWMGINCWARRIGDWVEVVGRFQYTDSSTITGSSSGNITDTDVCTLDSFYAPWGSLHPRTFAFTRGAATHGTLRINDQGVVTLLTLAPTGTISMNDEIIFTAVYTAAPE